MTTAAIAVAVPAAQASISHCSASRPPNNTYVAISCTGSPGTRPNQYRTWAYCGTEATARQATWEFVDPSDPNPSTVICPAFTTVQRYGYNTR